MQRHVATLGVNARSPRLHLHRLLVRDSISGSNKIGHFLLDDGLVNPDVIQRLLIQRIGCARAIQITLERVEFKL